MSGSETELTAAEGHKGGLSAVKVVVDDLRERLSRED